MKYLLIAFCLFSFSSLFAQTAEFEQQYVVLNTGESRKGWISLDEETDLLYFKEEPQDEPFFLYPTDVESFTFGGHQYFTLPLTDKYATFLKVMHEGSEFAVLEKTPNLSIIKAIAAESQMWTMSQDTASGEYYLCYSTLFPGTEAAGGVYFSASTAKRFKVERLVFLALDGTFKLFYMDTDEQRNILDNGKGVRPRDKMVEIMLDEFIKDNRKLMAVQSRARREKLDIRDPYELAKALEAVYQ